MEKPLNLVSDVLPGGLIKVTLPDFSIYYHNKGFTQLLALSEEEYSAFFASPTLDFIYPKDLEAVKKELLRCSCDQSPLFLEFRILQNNKEIHWIQLNGTYLEEHDGKHAYLCFFMDICKQHAYEEDIMLEQQRSSIIAELQGDYFWEYDISTESLTRYGNLSKTSDSSHIIYNWKKHILENKIVHPHDVPRLENILSSPSEKMQSLDLRLKSNLGIYIWHKLKYRFLFNSQKEPVRIFGQAINLEVPNMQTEISFSLLGKSAAIKQINRSIQQMPDNSHCGLMLLCLPNFAEYQKTFGYTFCQNLLSEFSLALFGQFREQLIGHLETGRFLVFFADASEEQELAQQAKDFLSSLENLYISQDNFHVACNIGLVLGDKNSSNYDILYKKASIALETAQKKGKRSYDIYGLRSDKAGGCASLVSPTPVSHEELPCSILKLGLSLAYEETSGDSMHTFSSMVQQFFHAQRVLFLTDLPDTCSKKELLACCQPLKEKHCLFCNDISSLNEKAPLLFESLSLDGIQNFYCYAMHYGKEITGFFITGFSKPLVTAFNMSFFQIIGSLAEQITAKHWLESYLSASPVDQVTSLPTFPFFLKRGRRILTENKKEHFALVYLDINKFHTFNQNFGFGVGNQILELLGHSIQSSLREKEIGCRIERDHFSLLLHYEKEDEIFDRLNCRIRSSLLQSSEAMPDFYRFDIIKGVYFIPQGETEISEMLDYANAAHQSIKGFTGSHYACYTPHLADEALQHRTTLEKLTQGLKKKSFLPFYQPRYSLSTGEITGAEALARWESASFSIKKASEFLLVMEKTGMVIDMDFQIIEHICRFLSKRLAAGLECVSISVNLSELHFKTTDFVKKLLSILTHYKVPVSLFKLEISEEILIHFPEEAAIFINELKSFDFFITIDHFGEIYSPLILLKNINIDAVTLNIRAFCSKQPSPQDWLLLQKVIETVKGLGLIVYANSVENDSLVPKLKELGCDEIQGYLYSKPLPEAAFEALFNN